MTSDKQGFTLVELMIAMVLSLIVMGLIYSGYKSQQEAHTNERLTVDMQQNARSTLAFSKSMAFSRQRAAKFPNEAKSWSADGPNASRGRTASA